MRFKYAQGADGHPRSASGCMSVLYGLNSALTGFLTMVPRRLLSLVCLFAFLITGGLSGYARVDLCFDANGTVEIESPLDRCCDELDHAGAHVAVAGVNPSDCGTCTELPLGTGEAQVTSGRQHHPASDVPTPIAFPATFVLLPPPSPTLSLSVPPPLRPDAGATHPSVGITVLRC